MRGIAFPFLYIPLFFMTFLPVPSPSPFPPLCLFLSLYHLVVQYALPPASHFFQSGNALTRARTYCMLDRVTKWTRVRGDWEEVHRKVVCCFYFRSVKLERIPLVHPIVFWERIPGKKGGLFGDGGNRGTKRDEIFCAIISLL